MVNVQDSSPHHSVNLMTWTTGYKLSDIIIIYIFRERIYDANEFDIGWWVSIRTLLPWSFRMSAIISLVQGLIFTFVEFHNEGPHSTAHCSAQGLWGADCVTLLKLCWTHVRSKVDFGFVVYGSARPSALESLGRVVKRSTTCLGAFRTSRMPSLHVEASEMPFYLRRQQLSLQCIVKLRSNPSNPAFHCVFGSGFSRMFEATKHHRKS